MLKGTDKKRKQKRSSSNSSPPIWLWALFLKLIMPSSTFFLTHRLFSLPAINASSFFRFPQGLPHTSPIPSLYINTSGHSPLPFSLKALSGLAVKLSYCWTPRYTQEILNVVVFLPQSLSAMHVVNSLWQSEEPICTFIEQCFHHSSLLMFVQVMIKNQRN